MKLILVRHGQTEWNLERRIQGWKNSALTADAKEMLSGCTLSELNLSVRGTPAFYSSDLGRAYESAEILANPYSSNVVADMRLRERKLGVLEGKVIDQDKELMPFWRVYHNRYSEKIESAFGVESELDFESRILSFIEHLRQRDTENDDTIVIVSHGEWIRAFINIINGIPSWHKGRGIEDNGLPVILELPTLISRETA